MNWKEMQILYQKIPKSKKEKITKARQEELEKEWKEHNKRLKQIGLKSETFEQFLNYVYGKTEKIKSTKEYKPKIQVDVDKSKSILPKIENNYNECGLKESPKYTGNNILGIGVLHKSCLQPIFNNEQAKDIAKMRR